MEWVSLDDAVPDIGKEVLVYYPPTSIILILNNKKSNRDIPGVFQINHILDESGEWYYNHTFPFRSPTHWVKLTPPTED